MKPAEGIAAFVDRRGDRAGEVVWWGALSLLERAAEEARNPNWSRWRFYPRGELRRLRRDVCEAMELARLAVAMSEEYDLQTRELEDELVRQAEDAARRRRREGTLRAEEIRLENARRRRNGAP